MRTPGPWKISRRAEGHIVDRSERLIAGFMGYSNNRDAEDVRQTNLDNAEFALRACNCHADLLAACKALLEDLRRINMPMFMDCNNGARGVRLVMDAIKKAEGREE